MWRFLFAFGCLAPAVFSADDSANVNLPKAPPLTTKAFAPTDEDRLYAVAVTMLRPTKLKWKIGNFGTFTPTERIYARIVNLCRLGADSHNYMSGLRSCSDLLDGMPIPAGTAITAHGPLSVFAYVTETDVAAVRDAKHTWDRMRAYLMREAAITHVQAQAAPWKQSAVATIEPGPAGSIVLDMEGQGYECDLLGTIAGKSLVIASLGPKSAVSVKTPNDWAHVWWGRVTMMHPIAATMDGQDFTWQVKVYSASTNYQGFANARLAPLPADWESDTAAPATR